MVEMSTLKIPTPEGEEIQYEVVDKQAREELEGKLPASELETAVEAALAQAKASGEFDGPAGPTGPQGPEGPAGSDASVTAANIKNALGYTPADQEDVTQLSEEIVNKVLAALPVYDGGVS